MSKKVLLNNINNQHNYNGIRDSGVNSNSNFKHDNNFINNFTNIPFDPNGRDATMEAAAAAAQYFQQLMLQIPLNEYSNIKINIPTEPYTTEGRGVNALTSKGKLAWRLISDGMTDPDLNFTLLSITILMKKVVK